MRLLPVVALTLWLAGASASVGEDPYRRFRKEYGKGLPLELADEEDEEDDDEEGDDGAEEDDGPDEEMDDGPDNEKDDGREDGRMRNDDTENSGKTKETSVHRKHFMDQYYLQSGPVEYEFGHVCEDPDDWEQRYEKRDFDNHRHQGQVKWGDAKGGYGEQLWDFNHDGNIDDEPASDSWYQEPRTKGFREKEEDSFDSGKGKGSKARGVIKEKVTITKKKNGRTVDQTKINMEKLADLDHMVKKHEPQPFAGDLALIEEFNRKTQGVKKKFNPFEDEEADETKGYFSFEKEIRRMGKAAPVGNKIVNSVEPQPMKDQHLPSSKNVVLENKEIRRHDRDVKTEPDKSPLADKKTKPLSIPDLISKATINIDTKGKVQFDPISGSLTDGKTGKKFKIFGVLMDS